MENISVFLQAEIAYRGFSQSECSARLSYAPTAVKLGFDLDLALATGSKKDDMGTTEMKSSEILPDYE